jgi:hypothetical protein
MFRTCEIRPTEKASGMVKGSVDGVRGRRSLATVLEIYRAAGLI